MYVQVRLLNRKEINTAFLFGLNMKNLEFEHCVWDIFGVVLEVS